VLPPGTAAALAAKGWIAEDTEGLSEVIGTLDTKEEAQEGAKDLGKGATGDRNLTANELFDGLLAIQNAAGLKWKACKKEHESIPRSSS
jgi:hypothetical protein